MDATYTMIGADGLQYGPITLDQLKGWITEGRVTAETKILRSDTNSWLPAANYTELELTPAAPAVMSPVAGAIPATLTGRIAQSSFAIDPLQVRRMKRGASWFYVVAVFSIINYFMMQSHGGFFLVGMGINIMTNSLVVTVVVAAIFATFGYFSGRGHTWAFIVGMILYALDALIFFQVAMWLALAFHAYALFRMFLGLKASIEVKSEARGT